MTRNDLTIILTGDLMFYGPLTRAMNERGEQAWPLLPLRDALQQCDLLFGNLETPISKQRQAEPDAPSIYCANPGVGSALKSLGYDFVNLANNHIYDFGREGVETTIDELARENISFAGIGVSADEAAAPVIITARSGHRVAVLAYTTMCNALDAKHAYVGCYPVIEQVRRNVTKLKGIVDTIIVSCHTGAHKNPHPAPEARLLAHAAIEAGAAIYVGHHPHITQGVERIGSGVAVYSLGDFASPPHDEDTRRTCFVKIRLHAGAIKNCDCVPCYITDECQTVPAPESIAHEFHLRLAELNSAIISGRSDELHFTVASSRLLSLYREAWINEFKQSGTRIFIRKLRNLKPYHWQIVRKAIARRLLILRKSNTRNLNAIRTHANR